MAERPSRPLVLVRQRSSYCTNGTILPILIRLRATDLEADAAAFNADGARSGPTRAALVPAGQVSFSIFPAEYKGPSLQCGNNNDAVCVLDHFLRNAFVGVAMTSENTAADSSSRFSVSLS